MPAIIPTQNHSSLILPSSIEVPILIANAGESTTRRYLEFFAAQIRNKGTRQAYLSAVNRFYDWCHGNHIELHQIEPLVVATYIEWLMTKLSNPTVKVHLAAIRRHFDWLVIGQVFPFNPASAVRGPVHVVKKGKTPVLSNEEARELIESIDTTTLIGLRDRALIGIMVYSFARVSAVLGMNVDDCFDQGRRMWFRLHEKGGKHHEVPAHHCAEEFVDEYIKAAGIENSPTTPLFRTFGPDRKLSNRRMHRVDALRMIKRRAKAVGLSPKICCHSWRATGITAYRKNGGVLEHAMQIACHESAETTKLYDRTSDDVSLDEIERIVI